MAAYWQQCRCTSNIAQRLAAFLLVVVPTSSVYSNGVLRTVALSGQPAPGTGGLLFSNCCSYTAGFGVATAAINDEGQVAFDAGLSGSGINSSNYRGIWSEGSGSLELVLRAGSPAPGTPLGVVFSDSNYVSLNNAGKAVVRANVGGSVNSQGLWSNRSGSLGLVVRLGDPAPGTPSGVTFGSSGIDRWNINSAGQISFSSFLSGPGVDATNSFGYWAERSGALELLARSGTQAPSQPSGVNLGDIVNGSFSNGHLTFRTELSGPGVDVTNLRSVWSTGSGNLALVVRQGGAAPGTPAGITFRTFGTPRISDTGQVVFLGTLFGSGVTGANDNGIWSDRTGAIELVAREGDQAPGMPAGMQFGGVFAPFGVNDAGQIIFRSGFAGTGVDSTNDVGIWISSPGSSQPVLVAREGDHAPGTPSGVAFSNSFAPFFNDAGQIAFHADLIGTGVNAANDRGIWATDLTGTLRLIAREGDTLEVAPGDFRTILDNYDLGVLGFNNRGQVLFRAVFDPNGYNQGLFISNLVAIPEPSALLMVAIGMAIAALRRKSYRSTLV